MLTYREDRPGTRLYPYFRNACADLYRHGFCFIHNNYLADLKNDPASGEQLELFRQTCRLVSDEKGQNLIIDDQSATRPGEDGDVNTIIVCLAPYGHPGTLADLYKDEMDKHGVIEKDWMRHDPNDPVLMEINASNW